MTLLYSQELVNATATLRAASGQYTDTCGLEIPGTLNGDTLGSVDFFLSRSSSSSGTGNVYARLYTDTGSYSVKAESTNSIAYASISVSGDWFNFTFASGVTLETGDVLCIYTNADWGSTRYVFGGVYGLDSSLPRYWKVAYGSTTWTENASDYTPSIKIYGSGSSPGASGVTIPPPVAMVRF